jgi:ABC-type glycerol-3-phosphate transport system permease component
MLISLIIYIIVLTFVILRIRKLNNRIVKIALIIVASIILLPVIFMTVFSLSTSDCYERKVEIKPAWSINNNDIGRVIYVKNDSLFSVYYSIDLFSKDTTIRLFLIDKNNGKIVNQIANRKPEKIESLNYYMISNEIFHFSIAYDIDEKELVLTENYKGYKITLNSWHKNIRTGNNSYFYFAIYKDKELIKKEIVDFPMDIAWDNEAVFIVSDNIMKYSYESIIKK